MSGCRRAEYRRAAREAAKTENARHGVAVLAALAGCTCDPDVDFEAERTVCAHDDGCPLAGAGTSVFVEVDGQAIDATPVVDLAIESDTVIVAAIEGVIVVPDSQEAPETLGVYCDIAVAHRPGGRTATVYKLTDTVIAGLEAQIGGDR